MYPLGDDLASLHVEGPVNGTLAPSGDPFKDLIPAYSSLIGSKIDATDSQVILESNS